MSSTAGRATRAGAGLSTTVLRDEETFAALSLDWARLHEDSPSATPFQTHAWLTSWWAHYGSLGELRVFLVHEGGRLVAAAPLHLARRGPWRVLAPIGEGISDFTDVLVAAGPQAAAARTALRRALLDEPGWHAVDLPEVRPGAAVEDLLAEWPGGGAALPASVVLELPGVEIAELISTRMPKDSASHVRRRLRKADKLGLTVRGVPGDEVPAAVDRLLHLHTRQWEGRGMNPEHGRPRFSGHLRTALPRMVGDGSAVLSEYRLGDEVVLVTASVVGRTFLGGYLAGMAPELRKQIDVAVRMTARDLALTAERGIPAFSMLRGGEGYKGRFRPDTLINQRVVLARPQRLTGRLYELLARSRSALVQAAKTRAPWLREVRNRAQLLVRSGTR
jgi:CelD/BcsL family acetyltransferase involved in cellulose biosynthesis